LTVKNSDCYSDVILYVISSHDDDINNDNVINHENNNDGNNKNDYDCDYDTKNRDNIDNSGRINIQAIILLLHRIVRSNVKQICTHKTNAII
jgi:hypothetical protein